jgi:integrase
MDRALTPDAYLLRTARTEKFSVSGLWLRWKLHCPKKLHSARHTFATMTYQATKDLRLLQKQLSHSRITTTQIYADGGGGGFSGRGGADRIVTMLTRLGQRGYSVH